MRNHEIMHVEFAASDPEAAARFYAALFGWEIGTAPGNGYVFFRPAAGPGGGFVPDDGSLAGRHRPGDVLVHVRSDDIEADLAKAEALGGTVLVPKTALGGEDAFAIVADPTGNRVALVTMGPRPTAGEG